MVTQHKRLAKTRNCNLPPFCSDGKSGAVLTEAGDKMKKESEGVHVLESHHERCSRTPTATADRSKVKNVILVLGFSLDSRTAY